MEADPAGSLRGLKGKEDRMEQLKNDLMIIKSFLQEEYEAFQTYLEDLEIEPTEAEVIIGNIEKAFE